MKILFVVAIFGFGQLSAQKVTTTIDKFTKERRISAEWAPLDMTLMQSAQIGFRAVDSLYFITIACSGAYADVIGEGNEFIFLLENSDTIITKSPTIQSYDIGYGGDKIARHSYLINKIQLKKLGDGALVSSIRKHSTTGYFDRDVKKKNALKVRALARDFLKAIE